MYLLAPVNICWNTVFCWLGIVSCPSWRTEVWNNEDDDRLSWCIRFCYCCCACCPFVCPCACSCSWAGAFLVCQSVFVTLWLYEHSLLQTNDCVKHRKFILSPPVDAISCIHLYINLLNSVLIWMNLCVWKLRRKQTFCDQQVITTEQVFHPPSLSFVCLFDCPTDVYAYLTAHVHIIVNM